MLSLSQVLSQVWPPAQVHTHARTALSPVLPDPGVRGFPPRPRRQGGPPGQAGGAVWGQAQYAAESNAGKFGKVIPI